MTDLLTTLPGLSSETSPSSVISLGSLFKGQGRDTLTYPAIEAVQSYWEELRAGQRAPARAQIDPRPIAQCLDVMFIAELVAPTVARIRLAGQRLYDLTGMEPRGMPLSVFLASDARPALDDALLQVAQGARVLLPLRAGRSLGRPPLDARMMLLPLTDAQGQITRILGVLEVHGQTGRAPRPLRLSAAPIPDGVSPATATPAPTPCAPTASAPGGFRARLRVIEGGKR